VRRGASGRRGGPVAAAAASEKEKVRISSPSFLIIRADHTTERNLFLFSTAGVVSVVASGRAPLNFGQHAESGGETTKPSVRPTVNHSIKAREREEEKGEGCCPRGNHATNIAAAVVAAAPNYARGVLGTKKARGGRR